MTMYTDSHIYYSIHRFRKGVMLVKSMSQKQTHPLRRFAQSSIVLFLHIPKKNNVPTLGKVFKNTILSCS